MMSLSRVFRLRLIRLREPLWKTPAKSRGATESSTTRRLFPFVRAQVMAAPGGGTLLSVCRPLTLGGFPVPTYWRGRSPVPPLEGENAHGEHR